ncbi:MAG: hypothetical protein ACTHMA_10485 [Thermomicrobiales bacterium]
MSQQVTTETLAAAELPAVRVFLATQNMLGKNAPAFTAPGVLALMAQLDTLANAYPQIKNTTLLGWIDTLYDDLAQVTTVYKQPFPALYIAYHLATFPFSPYSESVPQGYYPGGFLSINRVQQTFQTYDPNGNVITVTEGPGGIRVPALNQTFAIAQHGVYPAFRQTCVLIYHQVVQGGGTYDEPGDVTRAPWGGPPAAPPRWNQAVNDLLQTWAMQPPTAVIPLTTFDDYAAVQHAVLAPTAWTDVEQVKAGVASVWAAQVGEVRVLLQPATLTADTYFFLLHVLVGLLTGDTATATLVEQLVSAVATSQEYPNDTFINQLIYLALMYLGDPLGPYGWNNAQLQTALTDISSVVANVGPAAPLILTSLAQHQKLLYAAASYPLVDPYNPGIGFTQRKTDTLAALDKARASLHAALPTGGEPPVRIVRQMPAASPPAR